MSVFEHLIAEGGLREHVALGPMTTYKSGGPARYFAEIPDRESLNAVISSGLPVDVPTLILGRGSNLLVSDAGFDGLVIHLVGEFQQISLRTLGRCCWRGSAFTPHSPILRRGRSDRA